MDILIPQFKQVTQSKKWVCWMLLVMHHSDWLYLQYRKQASAAPCHAPFPLQSSSKPSLWAVFPGNFKASLPQTVQGKDQQQVNMTEGCSFSYTLSRAHTCTLSSSLGGKHKLDITACKKVIFILWQTLLVQFYFRWMLSSVVIHNISLSIQE